MLQQTRIEAAKDYFVRFTEELPDIQSLANVPQERLLKLWEGLGYYNRAKNLQKTAKILVEEYGAELPSDYEKLLALPGIGPYTAGAIASIAYDIKVPAVDGNVLRVMMRYQASLEDITKTSVRRRVEGELTEVMPERPGDFNQAIMELGEVVCIPKMCIRDSLTISVTFLLVFMILPILDMFTKSVVDDNGFTWSYFKEFFSKSLYAVSYTHLALKKKHFIFYTAIGKPKTEKDERKLAELWDSNIVLACYHLKTPDITAKMCIRDRI